jgi:hypothetical protein
MFLADGTKIQNIEAYLSRQRANPKALYREDGTLIEHPTVFLAILKTQWARQKKPIPSSREQQFPRRPDRHAQHFASSSPVIAATAANTATTADSRMTTQMHAPRSTTSHSTSVTQLAIKH